MSRAFVVGVALMLCIPTGCKRAAPTATSSQMGVKINSRTISSPGMHGGSQYGEVWLDAGGTRFRNLDGCPPYYEAVPGDPFIVMSRMIAESRTELVFLNTSTGKYFAIPNAWRFVLGCSETRVSRTPDGMLSLMMDDEYQRSVQTFDTGAGKKVSESYEKKKPRP